MLDWLNPKTAVAMATGPTARKSAVAVVDQGILSATNFFTGLMLARLCSKEEFGAYALAFSAMLAANMIQAALITTPMTVLGPAREGDNWRGYAASLARFQMVLGLGTALVIAGASAGLFAIGAIGMSLASTLLSVAAATFFTQGQEFCRRVLYARMHAWRVLLNDAGYCALQVTGIVAVWRLGSGEWGLGDSQATPGLLNGRNVVLVMGGSAAIATFLGVLQIGKDLCGSVAEWRRHAVANCEFGRWGLGSVAGSFLTLQASAWIIGGVAGVAAVGTVEAARLLGAPLHVLGVGGTNVLGPRAAQAYGHGGTEGLLAFVKRLAPIWLLGFLSYGALVAAKPELWLGVLYRGKYSAAGVVVLLWLVAYVSEGLARLPALVLLTMRRPDTVMWIGLVAGGLVAGLTAVSTYFGGEEWAVVGRVIGAIVVYLALSGSVRAAVRSIGAQERLAQVPCPK